MSTTLATPPAETSPDRAALAVETARMPGGPLDVDSWVTPTGERLETFLRDEPDQARIDRAAYEWTEFATEAKAKGTGGGVHEEFVKGLRRYKAFREARGEKPFQYLTQATTRAEERAAREQVPFFQKLFTDPERMAEAFPEDQRQAFEDRFSGALDPLAERQKTAGVLMVSTMLKRPVDEVAELWPAYREKYGRQFLKIPSPYKLDDARFYQAARDAFDKEAKDDETARQIAQAAQRAAIQGKPLSDAIAAGKAATGQDWRKFEPLARAGYAGILKEFTDPEIKAGRALFEAVADMEGKAVEDIAKGDGTRAAWVNALAAYGRANQESRDRILALIGLQAEAEGEDVANYFARLGAAFTSGMDTLSTGIGTLSTRVNLPDFERIAAKQTDPAEKARMQGEIDRMKGQATFAQDLATAGVKVRRYLDTSRNGFWDTVGDWSMIIAESSPTVIAMAMPGGAGLPFAAAAYSERNLSTFRRAAPNADESSLIAAAYASGMIEAGIDKLQILTLGARLPKLNARLMQYGKPGAVAVGIARAGVLTAAETGQEIAQDLTLPAVQEIAAALSEDIPGPEWGSVLEKEREALGDIAGVSLIFGIIGAAGSTALDYMQAPKIAETLKDRDGLALAGYSPETVETVATLAETNPAAAAETLKAAMIETPTEERQANAQAARQRIEEEAAETPTPEAAAIPTMEKQEDGRVIVNFPDAPSLLADSPEAALEAVREWEQAQEVDTTKAVREYLDFLTDYHASNPEAIFQGKQTGKTETLETWAGSNKDRIARANARVDILIRQAGAAMGIERPLLADVPILGTSRNVRAGGLTRMVAEINNGGSPLTVIEEAAEGVAKWIMADGKVSETKMIGWIRQTEQQTRTKILADDIATMTPEARAQELAEGFSYIAKNNAVGKIEDSALPSAVKAFFRAFKELIASALRIAADFARLRQEGKIDGEFTWWLDIAAGLEPEFQMDNLTRQMEAEMLAESMQGFTEITDALKGRIPHPETLEANGEPLAGEVRRLYEGITENPDNGASKAARTRKANEFFLPRGQSADLDEIRRSVNADGFDFQTPAEMIDALDLSLNYGRKVYGTANPENFEDFEQWREPTWSIGGPLANLPTFMRDSLDTARAMAADGKPPETIRAVTGWFPGRYDGKLRFEIPDQDARVSVDRDLQDYGEDTGTARLSQLIDHPALFEAYPDARDIRVEFNPEAEAQGSFDASLNLIQLKAKAPAAAREEMRSALARMESTLEERARRDVDDGDFPDLDAALAWHREANEEDKRTLETFQGITGRMFSTILHEVQHWIQRVEGFATGGSPAGMSRIARDIAGRLYATGKPSAAFEAMGEAKVADYAWQAKTWRANPESLTRSSVWFEVKDMSVPRRSSPERAAYMAAAVERAIEKLRGNLEPWQLADFTAALAKDRDDLRRTARNAWARVDRNGRARAQYERMREIEYNKDPGKAREFYRLLAGEIEARDVQARQSFTDEQRAAVAPYSSENIAPEDAIVVFDQQPEAREESAEDDALPTFSVELRRVAPVDYPATAREVIAFTNVSSLTSAMREPGAALVPLDDTKAKPMMVSEAYRAAKRGGDMAAAWNITGKFINAAKARPLAEALAGRRPVFVPVTQAESDRVNMLPIAAAHRLQSILGGRVEESIHIPAKATGGNTGADAVSRMARVSDFTGTVTAEEGEAVILVDDTFTTGNTLTALFDYIAGQGTTPQAVFTIASGRYSKALAPTPAIMAAALDKAGVSAGQFERETGLPIERFTGAELRAYTLNGARGIDGFRQRFSLTAGRPGARMGTPADRAGEGREVSGETLSITLRTDPLLAAIEARIQDPERKAAVYLKMKARVSDVKRRFEERRLRGEFDTEDGSAIDRERFEQIRDIATLEAIGKALPPDIRGKIVGSFRKVADLKTPKGRRAYMLKLLPRIESALESSLKRHLRAAIRRQMKQAAFKVADSRTRGGKIGAIGHTVFEQAREAMKLTDDPATRIDGKSAAEKAEAMAATLRDTLENAPDLTPEQIEELDGRIAAVELFGDYGNADSARLQEALDFLAGKYAEGRKEWLDVLSARRAWRVAQVQTIEDAFGIAGPITDAERNAAKRRFENALTRLDEAIMQAGLSGSQKIRRLAELSRDPATVALAEEMELAFLEAENQEADMNQADNEALAAAMRRIFGTSTEYGTAKKLRELTTATGPAPVEKIEGRKTVQITVPLQYVEAILAGELAAIEAGGERFSDEVKAFDDYDLAALELAWEQFNELPEAEQARKRTLTFDRITASGERRTIGSVNQLEGLQLYLTMRQPDQAAKLERLGYDEITLDQLEDWLRPEVKALGAWMVGHIGKEAFTLDSIHRAEKGVGLKLVSEYFPVRNDVAGADNTGLSLDGGQPRHTGRSIGAIKERVPNNAPPAYVNALAVFLANRAQVNFWKSHVATLREWGGVIRDERFAAAVKTRMGETYYQSLETMLRRIESGGALNAAKLMDWERLVKQLTSSFAVGTLGGRVSTLAINTTAALNVALEIPAADLAAGLAELIERPEAFADAWNSPAIQRRLSQGSSFEAQLAKSAGPSRAPTLAQLNAWAQRGVMPINWIDTGANTIGAAIVWEHTRREGTRAGMTEEQARAAADRKVSRLLLRAAQPTTRLGKSELELKAIENPLAALFTLFTSEPRKNLAITYLAARELLTGRGTYGKPMAAQQVFVAFVMLQTAEFLIRSAYAALAKAEDDEPENAIDRLRARIFDAKAWGYALTTNHLRAVPIAGEVWNQAWAKVFDQKAFASSQNPLNRAAREVFTFEKPETTEEAAEGAIDILQGIGPVIPGGALFAQGGNVAEFVEGLATSNGLDWSDEDRAARIKARFSAYKTTLDTIHGKTTGSDGKARKDVQAAKWNAMADRLRADLAPASPEVRRLVLESIQAPQDVKDRAVKALTNPAPTDERAAR